MSAVPILCCASMRRWTVPERGPEEQVVAHTRNTRVPAILLHDAENRRVVISFCPWCGTRLMPYDGLSGHCLKEVDHT